MKKRYAVPSEIVTFDVSEFLPKAFESGSLTVDVAERAPRVKAPKPAHDTAEGAGGVGGDEQRSGGRRSPPGARTVTVSCVLCPSSCVVRAVGGEIPVCSVRTTKPIRKDDWRNARGLIEGISVDAPVECGLTVIEGFLEPEIDLVATKSVRVTART